MRARHPATVVLGTTSEQFAQAWPIADVRPHREQFFV
jgi:hypothetical protein